MAPKVERVTESSALGEGPHWDAATQTLYYVDIIGQKLLRYTPATKKTAEVSVAPKKPSFILPIEGKKDQFLISLDNDLAIVSWDGESSNYSVVETLANVKEQVFNDGKADPSGRVWAGAHVIKFNELTKTEALGTLYVLEKGKKTLQKKVEAIKVANGLAFNEKTKKFFYIDSLKLSVDQFDFDLATGQISNRKVWFSVDPAKIPGIPDGMTIDTNGNLWVAIFNGQRVIQVDGHKPETLLQTIELPGPQVTSVAFGGANLDELYVTTGSLELEGKKLATPVNGSVYKITGTGAKGLSGVKAKI